MDSSSQFTAPTIIDVPELIVTNDDIDFDESSNLSSNIWINRLQSILPALSYIVNLGNIWHFPYLCYKHAGGAFLFTYTVILIAIGMPIFLMESAFGQYANEGPITIWRISPAFEGIGFVMCIISAIIAVYYNVINTWFLHYFLASLTFEDLPWSTCDNIWNTDLCMFKPENVSETNVLNNCTIVFNAVSNTTTPESSPLFDDNNTLPNSNCTDAFSKSNDSTIRGFDKIINSTFDITLPANEYFHKNVLDITESFSHVGGINWSQLFSLICVWMIVFFALLKNFRPLSSRYSIFMLIMPYVALWTLFVRSITLPGSSHGIRFYLTPEWSRLQNIDIWADATVQIFFSLSPCWGGIITSVSMNKFHNNFHAHSMFVIVTNYLTSVLVGLISFGALGYMSDYSGVKIKEVADVGIGFVFLVYTELLAKLPLAALNSMVFFGVFLSVGIVSQLTVIETVITAIVDTWPHKLRYRRPLVLMVLCSTMFLLGSITCLNNGFYLLQLVDMFAGTFIAMLVGILELIAIAWVYGMENFMQDIDDMISVHRNLFPSRSYWYFMWRYFTPSLLFAILLFSITDLDPVSYRNVHLPIWTSRFGWAMTFLCISIVPIAAFIRFLFAPGGNFWDKMNYLCRPSEDWAPSSYVSGPKLINRHQILEDHDSMLMHSGSNSTAHEYGLAEEGPTSNGSRELNSPKASRHSNCGPHHRVDMRQPDGIAYKPANIGRPGDDDDDDDNDSNDDSSEDLKIVNGKANYIIPEEEDDTDTGLVTNETDV